MTRMLHNVSNGWKATLLVGMTFAATGCGTESEAKTYGPSEVRACLEYQGASWIVMPDEREFAIWINDSQALMFFASGEESARRMQAKIEADFPRGDYVAHHRGNVTYWLELPYQVAGSDDAVGAIEKCL